MASDNNKLSKDARKSRCTYCCGNCGINFSTELSLMLHIANAHPDSLSSLRVVREVTTIFRCRLCEDEFTYLSDFNSHMSVHGPRNKTTIPIIAERIQVTKQKVMPPLTKVSNVSRPSNKTSAVAPIAAVHTRCFTCGKKCTESSGFSALDSVNFCIMPTLECIKCNQTFSTQKKLDEHNKIHTDSSQRQSKDTSSEGQDKNPDHGTGDNSKHSTSSSSAPIKLLKIEENANQQFKLYTCFDCNIKFANNITKAKKMLIPFANLEAQVAYGVPLNGPESESQSSSGVESGMSSKQQQVAYGINTIIPHPFVSSELSTKNERLQKIESKIAKDPSVLVGLLQKASKDVPLTDHLLSSEATKDNQESNDGVNVMSGILPDGSEFVIVKTDPSELDVNSTDSSFVTKMLNTSVKVKIEPNMNLPNLALFDSNVKNPCLSVDVPESLQTDTLPFGTIKPDPDAESGSVHVNDTPIFLESQASKKNEVVKVPDIPEVPLVIKTESTNNSYDPDSLDTVCQKMPQKNVVTRSMSKKNHQLMSKISTKELEVKNHSPSMPKHQNTPHDKLSIIDQSLFKKKQEKSELDLDGLLAVEKPLEGVSSLHTSIISNSNRLSHRVPSDALDKLLSIEKPFLYDVSPENNASLEKNKEEKDKLTIKTEPDLDSNIVIGERNENKNDGNTDLPQEHDAQYEKTSGRTNQPPELQVSAPSSSDNTIGENFNASFLQKTIKTEPESDNWTHWKLQNSSVEKTTESWPNKTDDQSETDDQSYSPLDQVKLENADGEDISSLPKLHVKQEKEDLSYEECANRFPGISPDSDSSSDDLQDSKDPNLYSVSLIKQESDDCDRLLRVRQDLFSKKGQKKQTDDQISENETSIDSPYLQPETKTEVESSNNESNYEPPKPIERIFVPQSMLGVHRMQLNDVLNNVKQKQVAEGSDLVDLLNQETVSVPNQTTTWRKNYRKRIADLMAGKEMTMEHKTPPRKYPNVQNRKRGADLIEQQMVQKEKQRVSKRSYYGRKIAELTALNMGIQNPLIQKYDKNDKEEYFIMSQIKSKVRENLVKVEKTKSQASQANLKETRNTDSPPLKRRNFYEKRIAELRAYEDIDILENDSVRLSKDSLPVNAADGDDDSKRKIDYKKRMADLDIKLKAIRASQKSKQSSSKAKENSACPTCKEVFKDQDSTIEHMRIVHGSKVVYKCDFCSKMFQNKEDKVQHQFVHIEETKNAAYKMLQSDQFKCNICNTNFLFSQSLVEHFRKFHSEDQTDS